jgi:hypothetical protein
MSDEFLSQHREEPRPEFQAALRRSLRAQEEADPEAGPATRRWSGWRPALSAAGGLALLAVLLSVPAVRATAQGFLDLFRVKRFAAVAFDPERLERLRNGHVDLKTLLGGQVEVLQEPGELQPVADVAAAAAEAGITVKVPAFIPGGPAEPEVLVGGRLVARATLDAAKIEALLQAFEVDDAEVPRELDGAVVNIETPRPVLLRYRRGNDQIVVAQSANPEVALPPGLDLARLGELGLRVVGLSREEARSFARTIDWRATLLIAVPAGEATYREVDLRGRKGLLVTSIQKLAENPASRARRRRSILLWSEGPMVFGVEGPGTGADLIEMAQSLR